ncbi:hypothetical protein T492DRAFT_414666 [Pavlovales sp. CCMP2436]|nr:hypothetical protein T492DRAFT_414666 [Pavlovales sp. CCMP2436]
MRNFRSTGEQAEPGLASQSASDSLEQIACYTAGGPGSDEASVTQIVRAAALVGLHARPSGRGLLAMLETKLLTTWRESRRLEGVLSSDSPSALLQSASDALSAAAASPFGNLDEGGPLAAALRASAPLSLNRTGSHVAQGGAGAAGFSPISRGPKMSEEHADKSARVLQHFARGRRVHAAVAARFARMIVPQTFEEVRVLEAATTAVIMAMRVDAAAAAVEAAFTLAEEAQRRGKRGRAAPPSQSERASARAAVGAASISVRASLELQARIVALRAAARSSTELSSELGGSAGQVELLGGSAEHITAVADALEVNFGRAAAVAASSALASARVFVLQVGTADASEWEADLADQLAEEWQAHREVAHKLAGALAAMGQTATQALMDWRGCLAEQQFLRDVRVRVGASALQLIEIFRLNTLRPSFILEHKSQHVAAARQLELAKAALAIVDTLESAGGLRTVAGDLTIEIEVVGGGKGSHLPADLNAPTLRTLLVDDLRSWYQLPAPFTLRLLSSSLDNGRHTARLAIEIPTDDSGNLPSQYAEEWPALCSALSRVFSPDVGAFGGPSKANRLANVSAELGLQPPAGFADMRVSACKPPSLEAKEELALSELAARASAILEQAVATRTEGERKVLTKSRMPTRKVYWRKGALGYLRVQDDAARAAGIVALSAGEEAPPRSTFVASRIRWRIVRESALGVSAVDELRQWKERKRQVNLTALRARAELETIHALRHATLAVWSAKHVKVPGSDSIVDVWWNLFPERAPPSPGEESYSAQFGKGEQIDIWSAHERGARVSLPFVSSTFRKRAGLREYDSSALDKLRVEIETRVLSHNETAIAHAVTALEGCKQARRRAYTVAAAAHLLGLQLRGNEDEAGRSSNGGKETMASQVAPMGRRSSLRTSFSGLRGSQTGVSKAARSRTADQEAAGSKGAPLSLSASGANSEDLRPAHPVKKLGSRMEGFFRTQLQVSPALRRKDPHSLPPLLPSLFSYLAVLVDNK